MADTTARPRRRAGVWWVPAVLAGLIIGVLLAGAGLAVTSHIDQDRYGWRWPAGIGAGALLAAILLVLAATLHEPRRAPRPVPTPADPAASRSPVAAEGPAGRPDRADAGADSDEARPGVGGSHRARTGTPGSRAAGPSVARGSAGADAAPAAGPGTHGSTDRAVAYGSGDPGAGPGSVGLDVGAGSVGLGGSGSGSAGAGTTDSATDGDAAPWGAAGSATGLGDDPADAGTGTFRRLAAVEPAELDAAWLGRPPGGAERDPGRPGVVPDGASFFGGTVPAGAIDESVAGDAGRATAAGPVHSAGTAASSSSEVSDPATATETAAAAESPGAAGTSANAGTSAAGTPADAGTSANAGTSADGGPTGVGRPGGPGGLAAGTGAAADAPPNSADAAPDRAEVGSGAASGVDRYGTPLAASGAALGGRAAPPAESARRDAVPEPRDGAARPVSAIRVPVWAAADAEHPGSASPDAARRDPSPGRSEPAAAGGPVHGAAAAGGPAHGAGTAGGPAQCAGTAGGPAHGAADATAAEGGRYEASSRAEPNEASSRAETNEATVPGLLPDEAERIAAVRAKLAGVLPPGTVGWQVPAGGPGAASRRAGSRTAPPRDGHARPADGAAPSHTARDAAVLRLADVRRAPAEWDPHVDIDPERTTDLRRGQGTPVRGYVRAGAAPVPQAAVTVIDLAGRQADKDVSGTDGWYELAVPRSGTYTLIARARGHQPLASVVAVDGAPVQLDLTLVGSAAIAGTVRLSGGATPVPAAVVSLMDSSGAVLGAVTAGADGTFRFAELIGGGYTVVGNAPGYRPVAVPVTVPSTGTAAVEVALTGDAVLAGIARGGRDHLPLADALVTLLDADGEVAGRCMTGPDGSYRFAGMPPGEYTLVASGYPTVSNALHLTAGSRHDHDIMLRYRQDDATGGE